MQDEYIIINKTAIQKRIEEYDRLWEVSSTNPSKTMLCVEYQEKIELLKEILSQSTPLIPEIEKAHNVGSNYGCYLQGGSYDPNDNIDSEDYISNLKLDI
jgi:hypothetical protein